MDTVLLIIILVLAFLLLITMVALAIVFWKRSAKSPTNSLEDERVRIKENEEIKASIAALEKTIPLQIQNSIDKSTAEQKIAIEKSMKEQAEADALRLNSFQSSINQRLDESIKSINEKVDANLTAINKKVDESLLQGFKSTSESMANLQKELGVVQEAQKNIDNLQSEIASLNGILTNSQQRGRYGEWQLELLLQSMFGETKGVLYDTQFILQKGKGEDSLLRPDAVIFLDGEERKQILCIDSKFSLTGYDGLFSSNTKEQESEIKALQASFKTAIKQRIEECTKYIIPGKTVESVVMFIPSDGVFAYIQSECEEVVDLARKKRVIIASPTILQPLLYSFRVMQIDAAKSKNLKKINEALSNLSADFLRFKPRWEKLQKDIESLSKSSETLGITVNKLDSKFGKIKGSDLTPIEEEKEPPLIAEEPNDDII